VPTEPARVQAVFLAAAGLGEADARAALLDRECADDPTLRRRVEALLMAHDQPDSLLDAPVVPSAGGETRTLPQDNGADAGATRTRADGPAADHGDARAFLAPPTRPDSLGRLGHYEVLEVLGRGGFGTVFKAFDDQLHRVVAVKVLAPQLAASGTARERFLREARAAAAVRDDHVVNIHAVQPAELPYLVMEYVAGQTLQQKLDKAGPLSVPEVLRIGSQIAKGLAAAHATGLVHRDVKPANILLENGVERVKLTDFGLARAADDASLSHAGAVAGTPQYMSPEQAQGGQIDHRSDLFSLGSVLYAMLTGLPPFRATTTLAVLKCVVEADPRPIAETNPETPGWLCAIIARLHAKDPAQRFGSAREVAELLQQHLAHLQQPAAVPMPAPVTVPAAARPAGKVPCELIFEGTDYPRRFLQFGVAIATFIPVYLFAAAVALGWIDALPDQSRLGVLVGFLAVHIAWTIGGLWLLIRLKHRWQVPYKGRTIRLELSALGSERLWVDGERVASCGWGFTFQALQATVPAGPGAGDTLRVVGQYGFLTPVCRIFASEGLVPPLTGIHSAWARVRRWAQPVLYVAAIVVPIALVVWLVIPQGWVSVKVDDPEMVVLLDGNVFVSGEGFRPGVGLSIQGRSIHTGDHTIRAIVRGKTVFEKAFHVGLDERREFDLTRAALGGDYPPVVPRNQAPSAPPKGKPRVLKAFTTNDPPEKVAFAGAGTITSEDGGWKVVSGAHGVTPLFRVGTPNLGRGTLTFRARVKSANLPKSAFLRLSVLLGSELKVGTISPPVTGVSDWTVLESSFAMDENHLPDSAMLDLVFDSRGTVWIKDVELLYQPAPDVAPGDAGWVRLFNGTDLTGWKSFPDHPAGVWTITDGYLQGKLPEDAESSRLVWTGKNYRDFHLRADVRIGDGDFGGILFRWDYPKLNPNGQPEACEAVINSNSPIKTRTGSLFHLGPDKAVTKRLVEPNVWFTYEVIARGEEIELKVNGETTVRHTDWPRQFPGDRIALELASPVGVIQFKSIEVRQLPAK
jgi:hypothetical protein